MSTNHLLFLLIVLVTISFPGCKPEPRNFEEEAKELLKNPSSRVEHRKIYLDLRDDGPICYVDEVSLHSAEIQDFAVSPNERYIVLTFSPLFGKDTTGIKVWSVDTGKEVFSASGIKHINDYYFDSQNRLLVLTDSYVALIDLTQSRPVFITPGSLIKSLGVSEDGSKLALFSADRHLRVYAVATQELLFDQSIERPVVPATDALRFSSTGKELLFFTLEDFFLVSIESGSIMPLKYEYTSRTAGVTPVRDKNLLISSPCPARSGERVILVDLQKYSYSAVGSGDCVTNVAYNMASNLVAELDFRKDSISVWDITKQHVVKIPHQQTARPTTIVFSSDGKQLIGFPEYGSVQVWDAVNGEEKMPTNEVNLSLTTGRRTNDLVRIKRKWYRLHTSDGPLFPSQYGVTNYGCLLFEEAFSQTALMQLCILNEPQGYQWVMAAEPRRFDSSEAGYGYVRPGLADIPLIGRAVKSQYYEPQLLAKVLADDFVPPTRPYLQRFSNNHLRGQHGSVLNLLLNLAFGAAMMVVPFAAALVLLGVGLQPALWRLIYCVPLHTRLLQLEMSNSVIPLIKDIIHIALRISLCAGILIFIDRGVGLPLVTLMFAVFILVNSFYVRNKLFALSVAERHWLLGSVLPYLNKRADITLVRLLVKPNYLLWTRLQSILVMAGLSLQKLLIFGIFVYAGLYKDNPTFFWFGIAASLWFYKHSNKEARSFLATSNATLIEQRTFRVYGDTILKSFEAIRKLFSFIARPMQVERLKSLVFAISFLFLRLVDTLLLSTMLLLLLYFPAVWFFSN